jgi:hypothetical protein
MQRSARAALLAATFLGASSGMTGSLQAQAPSACAQPREACAFLTNFLSAFNHRDWLAFKATLDPDVSVIFDRPGPVLRQDGHVAVEAVFRLIFPDSLPAGAPAPSQLNPQQLQVQDFGDVVVISFNLTDRAPVGRRTLILHRTKSGWHMIHIHGSSSS